MNARAAAGWRARLAALVLTRHPARRFPLLQWMTSATVYVFSALVMALGVPAGVVPGPWLAAWCGFVAAGLALFHMLLRSGVSQRWRDPALTDAQILFAVLTVLWGYAMCGPVRSATLFPLLLIFTFGAFSSVWQRLAALTVFTLIALALTMAAMHRWLPGPLDARVDIANFLLVAVMLPAASRIAAQLSSLRAKLRLQRAELGRAMQQLQRLATHDELTGLVNRRRMQELIEQERQRSLRSGEAFCVALIDIDHFKRINDRWGHAAGDEVLRLGAHALRSAIRSTDELARWGGEEFLLLLPQTSREAAAAVLQRMRSRLGELSLAQVDAALQITVSAGVALALPDEAPPATLERADAALYRAKRQGRDQVVFG